jgi:AhpD family alkylhydroperoxidase
MLNFGVSKNNRNHEQQNQIHEADPAGYKAMIAFSTYVANTALTKKHQELIKIRASQINGCAFCLDMHSKDARKAGETEQRIYTLSVWRDTPFFDEQEQDFIWINYK